MFVAPAAAAAASEVAGVITALLFSSTVLAMETFPTSQPSRVYETHGAGVVFCPSVIMFGCVSNGAATSEFQYLKAE